MKKNKLTTVVVLVAVLIVAIFLRVYKLDQVPPSLMWDEAAVGYNAFTVANYGRDEWGKFLPLTFKSFEEYKMPVHIYVTALFVKFGGLNELTTRLPAAVFGTLCVLTTFFLTRKLFNSTLAGLTAAILLAVSPYAIHFSRFSHEANFAVFFFILGVLLFLISIKNKPKFLMLSFFCFGLSLISYNAAKLVVPLLLFLLTLLYFKSLMTMKKITLFSALIFLIFVLLVIFYPGLSGKSRAEQTGLNVNSIEVIKDRYLAHFSWDYLIKTGDKNPRLGVQVTGQSNYVEIVLALLGVLAIFIKTSRIGFFLLAWLFIAPVPATIFGGGSEIPHAARASFSLGIWQILAANGFIFIANLFTKLKVLKKDVIKILLFTALTIFLIVFTKSWFLLYIDTFNRYAIEWQYGMKQIVDYVKEHKDYSQVNMTDVRAQPYIFFLYFLKTPLPQFLKTASYNEGLHRSSNLVTHFDKYYFGGWDEIESMPYPGVLYIVEPSKYDGLRHKAIFDVKKIIYYPNGSVAFYLVSI